ncbi:MAG: hypothetical protein OXJ53_09660 [Gammaproteobacteria bacterium]|nr:hypothetical protein [Gammaproteobacteria bacterium]MDE0273475.1 hypothetical protein [Gammaproteobacteria bacterium]
MSVWNTLTLRTLEQLGAKELMVPGAKLRQAMEILAHEQEFDIAAHLIDRGRSFSTLVSEVEGVTIQRRPGSDLLVGLTGSSPPAPLSPVTKTGRFRKDVWEAFTKLSPDRYVYERDADRFMIAEEAEGPSVPVPEVTLDLHMQDRQEFVKTLPNDLQDEMGGMLRHSSRPLADFRAALEARSILNDWMSFQGARTADRIREWARQNQIDLRQSWFAPRRPRITAHQTLQRLIPYMTNDEVYEIKVPLRVVEAMLRDQSQQ